MADPLGEKRKRREASKMDDNTRMEIFSNEIKFFKIQRVAKQVGVDIDSGAFNFWTKSYW